MNRLHEASSCPECGGPKSPSARRCHLCAGRGAARSPLLQIVEPATPTLDHWVISCVNCAREEFIEVSAGSLPTIRVRCAACKGWRHAERYDPHELASVDTPMRGSDDRRQEAA